jgi:hypothetical protein
VAENNYRSNVVVLNQSFSARIYSLLNAGYCAGNACTIMDFFKSPYTETGENRLASGGEVNQNTPNGGVMATPGLSLADLDRTSGMVYLYKLN